MAWVRRASCGACARFLSRPTSAGDAGGLAAVPKTDPEKTIGPYRLFERVGEGGFGEVWTATQSEPIRRTVAVKILKPQQGGDRHVKKLAKQVEQCGL